MEIKVNDWVVIDKERLGSVILSGYSSIANRESAPLQVYKVERSAGIDYAYCKTTDLAFNNFQQNPFTVNTSILRTISEKEAGKLIKLKNKTFDDGEKEKLKQLKTKHIPFYERKDYSLYDKTLLTTTHNYAKLFTGINFDSVKSTDDMRLQSNNWGAGCCAFSQTTMGIVMYIPKTWLNYFGYNLFDLKRWINFLKECKIDFDAKILGVANLHKKFSQSPSKTRLVNKAANFYLKPDEEAYEVLLKPNDYPYMEYLYFICMRYIYSNIYWNIPFIAMKLKRNMPNISHWDCLLLAHNMEMYNAGYSLANVGSGVVLLPKENSAKIIKQKLESRSSSMNGAFKLTSSNVKELRDLIVGEKYQELEEFLKK